MQSKGIVTIHAIFIKQSRKPRHNQQGWHRVLKSEWASSNAAHRHRQKLAHPDHPSYTPCAYLQRPNSSFIKLLAVQDERGPRKKTKESSHSSRGEERELTRKENLDGNYSFLKSVSNRK